VAASGLGGHAIQFWQNGSYPQGRHVSISRNAGSEGFSLAAVRGAFDDGGVMPTNSLDMRDGCADQSRPVSAPLLECAARAIDATADAVTRWLWVKSYERAEATYWKRRDNNNE
jgi:hypothetical protein